ncbi:MAG: hypothetical protein ACON4K_05380 [Akkermansiaceae bacterium]
MGAPMMAVYLWINQREGIDHRLLTMPDYVPFWPHMTIPYLLMLFAPWFGSFALREQRRFFQYLISITVIFGVIGSIWYLVPTEMTRPPTPDGVLYEPHRYLVSQDAPVCIFPCGHVMGPITMIWLLAEEDLRRLRWLLPLLAIGIVAVATTWQHRPIDIVIGSVISVICVLLVRKFYPLK